MSIPRGCAEEQRYVQPLRDGTIDEDDVIADLFELARAGGTAAPAGGRDQRHLFESVDKPLDLAADKLSGGEGVASPSTHHFQSRSRLMSALDDTLQ